MKGSRSRKLTGGGMEMLELSEREKVPAEWRGSVLMPIFKKKGEVV